MNATVAILAASIGVGLGHAILPDHWVPLAVLGRAQRYPLSKIARLSGLAGVAHVLLSIVLGGVIIVIGLQFRSTVESAQDTIVGGLLLLTGVGFIALELVGRGHHHGPGGHTHASRDRGHTRALARHAHAHDEPDSHEHEFDEHDSHEHVSQEQVSREHDSYEQVSHEHESYEHHTHEPHEHDPHEHGDVARGRGWRRAAAVMVPFGAAASPDLTILPVFLAAAAAGVATAVSSVVLFAAATIGTIVTLTLIAAAGGYQLKGEWLERWGNSITATVLVMIGTLVLLGVI